MPQRTPVRSSSKPPSTVLWNPSGPYNLRSLVSAPTPSLPVQVAPPTSRRISRSTTTHLSQGGGTAASAIGNTRTSQKRKRSLPRSRLVLPTVAPTSPKRRRIDKRQPLVTRIEYKEESGNDDEVIIVSSSSPPPSSQSTRRRANLAVKRKPIAGSSGSPSIPSIKKPIRTLSKSIPQCRRHRTPSQEDDSDVEFVSSCVPFGTTPPELGPLQRLSKPKSTPTSRPKPSPVQRTIRIPPMKRDQMVQTETILDDNAGRFMPGSHAQRQEAGFAPQYEEATFGCMEMKLLEERMHSWGQCAGAEDEMRIVVQNYLALEQELAETKEELRRAKNHKKRV